MKRITIEWIQKGHSTLDPTGTRDFTLSCTWSIVEDAYVSLDIAKAEQYAKDQAHWKWHLITVK